MFQLKQHQMIEKATLCDPRCRKQLMHPVNGHHDQALQIQLEFLRNGDVAVRFEMGIVPIGKHHKPMIQRPIKHMVARITPV